MWFNLTLILSLISGGVCLRYPYFHIQQRNVPSIQRSFLPISQESNSLQLQQSGYVPYLPTSRLRTPRNDMNYQLLTVSSPKTYRRYRSIFPTSEDTATSGVIQLQPYGGRQLRILSWLFGRPGLSPFPDYSPLEAAAGISHTYPSPLNTYHSSPVLVEECEEVMDSITHEIYEECEEVGTSVFPTYH